MQLRRDTPVVSCLFHVHIWASGVVPLKGHITNCPYMAMSSRYAVKIGEFPLRIVVLKNLRIFVQIYVAQLSVNCNL